MADNEEARELKRARLEPEHQPELLSDLVADAAEDDLTVHQRVEEQREQISAALAQVEQIQRGLEQEYNKLRWPLYRERNEVFRQIQDIWLQVFLNHSQLDQLIGDVDREVLIYLESVHVQDFEDIKSGYSITFTWSEANPFFANRQLSKDVRFSSQGLVTTTGEEPEWRGGDVDGDGQASAPIQFDDFLSWLTSGQEYEEGETDAVADIIKEQIWPNPIKWLQGDSTVQPFEDDDEDGYDEEDGDEGPIDLDGEEEGKEGEGFDNAAEYAEFEEEEGYNEEGNEGYEQAGEGYEQAAEGYEDEDGQGPYEDEEVGGQEGDTS